MDNRREKRVQAGVKLLSEIQKQLRDELGRDHSACKHLGAAIGALLKEMPNETR